MNHLFHLVRHNILLILALLTALPACNLKQGMSTAEVQACKAIAQQMEDYYNSHVTYTDAANFPVPLSLMITSPVNNSTVSVSGFSVAVQYEPLDLSQPDLRHNVRLVIVDITKNMIIANQEFLFPSQQYPSLISSFWEKLYYPGKYAVIVLDRYVNPGIQKDMDPACEWYTNPTNGQQRCRNK